jgi:hypothetical protein
VEQARRRTNENRLAAEVAQARGNNGRRRQPRWWRFRFATAVGLLARRIKKLDSRRKWRRRGGTTGHGGSRDGGDFDSAVGLATRKPHWASEAEQRSTEGVVLVETSARNSSGACDEGKGNSTRARSGAYEEEQHSMDGVMLVETRRTGLFPIWIPGTRAPALFHGEQEQVTKGIPEYIRDAAHMPALKEYLIRC